MNHSYSENFFKRGKKNINDSSSHKFHCHPQYELYYVVSGKTKYFVKGDIFTLTQGDFILIPKYEYHKTEYLSPIDTERIVLFFDDIFIGEKSLKHLEMLSQKRHFHISSEDMHPIRSIMRKLEEENISKSYDYIYMQQMYIRQLLILLLRHGQKVKENLNPTHAMIQDAARYISSNFNKDLNLDEFSKMYSLSPMHFAKQFKKATGVGFKDYVTITRMTAAKAMFDAGEKNVSKTAAACGFNNSNYFAKVFKEMYGIAPKKYTQMV